MSSANIRMFVPEEKERDAKSLIYERNNRGPKTEPWGTPDLTGSQGEEAPPRTTRNCSLEVK